jgi:hypothetical protein
MFTVMTSQWVSGGFYGAAIFSHQNKAGVDGLRKDFMDK